MMIYRVIVKTSAKGGVFLDGTHSLPLAIKEAQGIQAHHADCTVSVEAEDWPTLTGFKYRWYQLTGFAEGFGVEFQKKSGHRHTSRTVVWPMPRS